VTVVLDCCFSGNVKRYKTEYDVIVQGFDNDPTINSAFLALSKLTKLSNGQDAAKVFHNTDSTIPA